MAATESRVFLEPLTVIAMRLRREGLVCIEVAISNIKQLPFDEVMTAAVLRCVKPQDVNKAKPHPVTYAVVTGQSTDDEGGNAQYALVEASTDDDVITVPLCAHESHIVWDWTWGAMM